ncbi:MAG TPA: DNA polymerase/3'-5' exonuclease PolX [Candidatus Omnitrophota bacterium]|nr:DNA polymerase/3'-5' exonuclease PolX [Candidatus Omnitrophota bacterium]HPS20411.1 DNA polymerase/3'-5' exonuclease PolX [Candidatus Omnitrophota bacterium]
MKNSEIADVFSRIADILEIKNENIFKVRAYRTAALNILNLPKQLADIYKNGGEKALEDIPGIGKDLKEKIVEMLSTDNLKYFSELLKDFPSGFLDLLNLSGLGPKKLAKLRNELGIESIDALEKACKEDKLAKLDGMGEKTQANLLEAITYFKKQAGRMLFPEADVVADDILEYLALSKNFKKTEKAGSLRRGQETIGDIDILAVVEDSEKAMKYFAEFPGVEKVTATGPTKASVVLRSGTQVDLRVVDEACFGSALVYFTGSKAHNIKLRKIAKNKGYKVSEYGVFEETRSGKEKLVAARTENDVYKSLGMEWVPPELREDIGEIELAMEGDLPKDLIEVKHIKGDLHIHTTETDGRGTIEEMIASAEERGYEYVAITDHSQLVRIANGMDEKRLLKHAEHVRKIADKHKKIKVLVGIEVDILKDGKLDLEDYALKELDIVIAAVHSNFSMDKETQTARILRAMDNKYVNVLAHPSGRIIIKRSPMELDFEAVFKKARENGIFLEVNTHGKRIDLNDVHCRRAKEIGARFVIDTDAHEVSHMDHLIYGVKAARRGGLEKKDVLNTYPYEKMIKMLEK